MKKIKTSWLKVVALLLPIVSHSSLAAENDTLLMSLYPEGGQSLFCGTKFTQLNNRIRSTALYPLSDVRKELGCGIDSQCQRNNRYRLIVADLHNLFPMQSRVDLKRRNAIFGDISDNDVKEPIKRGCALSISFQTLEPEDNLKGDVARVYFYMADTYQMPVNNFFNTLLEWHLSDLPDDQELARNNQIDALQGTRNRFIDNPAQAKGLNF